MTRAYTLLQNLASEPVYVLGHAAQLELPPKVPVPLQQPLFAVDVLHGEDLNLWVNVRLDDGSSCAFHQRATGPGVASLVAARDSARFN